MFHRAMCQSRSVAPGAQTKSLLIDIHCDILILSNNGLVTTPINPLQNMCDDDFADSLKNERQKLGSHTFLAFATTSKRDFGVRLSISRRQCLPTHDSTNTHNHHHNYSIIHHPLWTILFFCVISPIFATLVKIFPWLMMCQI